MAFELVIRNSMFSMMQDKIDKIWYDKGLSLKCMNVPIKQSFIIGYKAWCYIEN